MKVEERLRIIEKKMWSIAGGIGIISILVSPLGQRFIQGVQTQKNSGILETQRVVDLESSRQQIHKSGII